MTDTDNNKISLIDLSVLPPEVTKELYGDLVQPTALNLGSISGALTGVISNAFNSIRLWNVKQQLIYAQNVKKLEEGFNKIEDDSKSEIPLELAAPIIEKLTYTSNSAISEMYINLLLKGASKETIGIAHPGFINTVASLSHDEALILKYLFDNNMKSIPAVDLLVSSIISDEDSRFFSDKTYSALPDMCNLDFPDNDNLYIHNLLGLGILGKSEGREELDYEFIYTKLENRLKLDKQDFLTRMTTQYGLSQFYNVDFFRNAYFITDYGIQFLKACNETSK
ncbi:hypothetical protein EL84_25920 [Paenibacillus sp. VT-400]|uniref:DUF4393 domain-containing protein n=1 Tax=Paenibacillus sp. VT-400 TaxID=1495853 RepID=UPI00064A0775|nr:DUF4393 domain-containing protein [Paenibacillus sp. VT-400]KLU55483.1 hypothetical protein EL84_25920 [Paenibacillus sp. VT-400]